MPNRDELHRQITRLFSEKLNLEVPSIQTDLIAGGLLDSLVFVDMVMFLEQSFGIEIPVIELEIDQFRSVMSIAKFVHYQLAQCSGATQAQEVAQR